MPLAVLRCIVTPLLILLAPLPASAQPPTSWHPEPVPGSGALTAIAADPRRGAVAVGDERGVAWRKAGRGWRRRSTLAAVQDLAFDAAGALWIATANGLFRLVPGGTLEDRSPARGEAARDVRRVVPAPGLTAVATGDGGYASRDGVAWRKLDGTSASGPAIGIAVQAQRGGFEIWIAAESGLFVSEAIGSGDRTAGELREVPLPLAGGAPLDVMATQDGLSVVTKRTVLVLREGDWEVRRPAWPPGIVPRRLLLAPGRAWLATDRGLLEGTSLAGPWRRAAPPLGSASIRALVSAEELLHVATERGYWVGHPAEPRRTAPGADGSCDPPVVEVQRVALRHVQLETGRVTRLRHRVARRGWLPVVSLHAEWSRVRDVSRDLDEAFLSGGVRRLFDRDRERGRDVEFGFSLTWHLGDTQYDPEEIDVSTEARRLLELRDDVLDEVNQLYFERRRLLGELAAGPLDNPESGRLRLRADELAAGLDAWTDGWFGCRVAACGTKPCTVRQ